jgi:hypothetical protein
VVRASYFLGHAYRGNPTVSQETRTEFQVRCVIDTGFGAFLAERPDVVKDRGGSNALGKAFQHSNNRCQPLRQGGHAPMVLAISRGQDVHDAQQPLSHFNLGLVALRERLLQAPLE